MPEKQDPHSQNNNNNSANAGFSAAEQRVMNRNRMAQRYTDMSNGVRNTPPPPPPPQENPPPLEKSRVSDDRPPPEHKPLIPGLPLKNADPEKLLLAALMLLLVSEGADFVLIAALIYVMM